MIYLTVTTSAVVVADLGVRDGYGLLGWLKKKEMEERREGGRDRDRKLKKKGRWGVGAIYMGLGKKGYGEVFEGGDTLSMTKKVQVWMLGVNYICVERKIFLDMTSEIQERVSGGKPVHFTVEDLDVGHWWI